MLQKAATTASGCTCTVLSYLALLMCRRYDLTDRIGAKLQLQMAPEKGMSQGMCDVEFKVRLGAMYLMRMAPV